MNEDELLERANSLLSGREISEEEEEEHALMETGRQIAYEEQLEESAINEDLEWLAEEQDPEGLADCLDGLEAWLLSPFTPRSWKKKIRAAIRAKFGSHE